ncbi:hypothetical protein F0U60_32145 [Archangium minus]|uniref:Uncharacterized protein n=1 Tax=Archangium minus TaxID=83450 RepID=A0ABY9WYP1_9BACT|nr:hypothetical protein F0U60_32145 [Archangium minus]
MLRYLLATQGRKRLLETYGLRRQMKSSALTGDPDHVFELYYAEDPKRLRWNSHPPEKLDETIYGMMQEEDAAQYQALQKIIDAEKLSAIEVLDRARPTIPHVRALVQMPYLLKHKSQEEVARGLATAPYLLNDICVLKDEDGEDLESRLSRFSDYVSDIIPTFAQSGFSLLAAGRFTDHPDWILNIWQLEDLEQHRELMLRLADNRVYSEIDKMCNQDQHLCRNVSRFYQHHPFLMTA